MLEWFMSQVDTTVKNWNQNIRAMVSPHAWYIYSWAIAAYGYHQIWSNWQNIPKTFVILWPSHHLHLSEVSLWLYDKYETPLWDVDIDQKLWKKLINDYPNLFWFIPEAHDTEHSVEVQLPFLQYISWWSNFKILPMILWHQNFEEVWNILNELITKEEVFLIVSTDLSHYKTYDDAIFTDKQTIGMFLSQNTSLIESKWDACWITPWLCLNHLSILQNWSPKLLKYANSWDTAGTKDQVVWYASMVYMGK